MQNVGPPIAELLAAIHETRLQAGLEKLDARRRRWLRTSIAAVIVVVVGFASLLVQNLRFRGNGGYPFLGDTIITDVALDLESSALITIDVYAHLSVWDSEELNLIGSADVPGFMGDCVHVLSEGQGTLVGGMDYSSGRNVAGLVCLKTGERVGNFDLAWTRRFGINATIRQIASSGDGRLLAFGTFEYQGANARVVVFDIAGQNVIREIQAPTGISVTGLAISPSGDAIGYATGNYGNLAAPGVLYIESLDLQRDANSTPNPAATVTCVQFASDGTRLLTADYAGNISVYDAADLSELRTWNAGADSIEEIRLVGGDRYLVVGGTKTRSMTGAPSLRNFQTTGMIQVWDLESGTLLDEEILPHGVLAGIAVIDNGRRVAAVSILDDEIYCVDLSGVIPVDRQSLTTSPSLGGNSRNRRTQ